jgi:hypothetical protein
LGSTRNYMRKFMFVLALAALAGCVFQGVAGARSTNFPAKGLVVPGRSIGGITLGMTEAQVEQRWGHNFAVCTKCGPNLLWLFEYPGSEPLGAAIKFGVPAASAAALTSSTKSGTTKTTKTKTTTPPPAKLDPTAKVVAVFTLGSPTGWGTKGAMMYDPVSNVYNLFGNTGDAQCIGYDALTVRIGASTMSFYTASGVIYGYALTAPSQSPCQ